MKELSAESDTSWKRQGCSRVWDKTLLAGLLQEQEPVSLREVLRWRQKGLPRSMASDIILVEGLHTCLQVLQQKEVGEAFLRDVVQPVIWYCRNNWHGKVLIFALHCQASAWSIDVANYATLDLGDGLVLRMTQTLWRGAAKDAYQLKVLPNEPGEKNDRARAAILGGFHVRRVS